MTPVLAAVGKSIKNVADAMRRIASNYFAVMSRLAVKLPNGIFTKKDILCSERERKEHG